MEGIVVENNGQVYFKTETGKVYDLPNMDILKEVFVSIKTRNEEKKLFIDPFTEETVFFREGQLIKLPIWKVMRDIYNKSIRGISSYHGGSSLEKSRVSIERYKDLVSSSDWKILEAELDVKSKHRSRKWHLAAHRAYSTYRRQKKIVSGSLFPTLTEEENNKLSLTQNVEADGATFTESS